MTSVETEIQPPGLDDEDGEPILAIMCCTAEGDDTRRSGYVALDPGADDAAIVAAMVEAMIGETS